jgi:hypothetical protein
LQKSVEGFREQSFPDVDAVSGRIEARRAPSRYTGDLLIPPVLNPFANWHM